MRNVILAFTCACVIVFPLGIFVGKSFSSDNVVTSPTIRSSQYEYVSPLLECNTSRLPSAYKQYDSLKSSLEKTINSSLSKNEAQRISLYFEDLTQGATIGLHEHEQYQPKSLYKVLTLMDFLFLTELDPSILVETLEYDGTSLFANVNLSDEVRLKAGSYSYKDILEQMIIQSDNSASDLLTLKLLDHNASGRIHSILGFEYDAPVIKISPKEYSRVFKILYNSSYLSERNSNYALDLLTKTNFPYALRAAVPDDIHVAHKFGVRNREVSPYEQLHDCGIVYYPDHPYLLCIMTEGENQDTLTEIIRELSSQVYTHVNELRSGQ